MPKSQVQKKKALNKNQSDLENPSLIERQPPHTQVGLGVEIHQHHQPALGIPVDQLEKLHAFKPDAVDWVIKQAEKEGDFRRSEIKRINTFTYKHKTIGQLFGLCIGLGAIVAGVYLGGWAGALTITASIGSLTAIFVLDSKAKKTRED